MAAKPKHTSRLISQIGRRVGVLLIMVLLGYLLITQVNDLSPGLQIVRHAQLTYVALGLLATTATFFVAAGMYQVLALHRLSYGKTLLVQVATGFANRLLPAGLGGIGLIAQYLRMQKHTTSEAVTVVGADNVLGVIGHFTLFFAAVIFASVSVSVIHTPHISLTLLLVVAVCIALLGIFRRLRVVAVTFIRRIVHDLVSYGKHPFRLLLAFGNSLVLTLLYISTLWACTYAVGAPLSFAKVLIVFTAGAIVGNATPTPGGLIGAEAGLFAGFVAYGLDSSSALAAALLYRLLTYWLPIVPGLLAFWIAQRKLRLI